jgi:hypothetical protein
LKLSHDAILSSAVRRAGLRVYVTMSPVELLYHRSLLISTWPFLRCPFSQVIGVFVPEWRRPTRRNPKRYNGYVTRHVANVAQKTLTVVGAGSGNFPVDHCVRNTKSVVVFKKISQQMITFNTISDSSCQQVPLISILSISSKAVSKLTQTVVSNITTCEPILFTRFE